MCEEIIKYLGIAKDILSWLNEHNFVGYDPYDYGCSKCVRIIDKFPLGKKINVYLTQIVRYSPINIRPIFGIRPHPNLNALAISLKSLLYLEKLLKSVDVSNIFDMIEKIIYSNRIARGNTYGWGRIDYPFYSSSGVQSKGKPIVFLTSLIGDTYLDLYERFEKEEYLKAACAAGEYLTGVADRCENKNQFCLYYIEGLKTKVFNANAFAAAFLARLFRVTNKSEYYIFSKKIMDWVVSYQNSDGSWFYGFSSQGKILRLIDFHQGYILDSLMTFIKYSPEEHSRYVASLSKGMVFYRNYLFTPGGLSFYRYPKWRYPVDIHNQAEGIIAFSRYGKEHKQRSFLDFARVILEWTVDHMWDVKRRIFYNYYTPLFSSKIPYIRWGQAWMLYAIAEYIKNVGGDFNECS